MNTYQKNATRSETRTVRAPGGLVTRDDDLWFRAVHFMIRQKVPIGTPENAQNRFRRSIHYSQQIFGRTTGALQTHCRSSVSCRDSTTNIGTISSWAQEQHCQ